MKTAARSHLALTRPRYFPGVSNYENVVYHDRTRNLDEYRERGIEALYPEPQKEELIAFLKNSIEAQEMVSGAAWEIHCAAHLISMLERGAS